MRASAMKNASLSIIIPAKNEEQGLRLILPELRRHYPDDEILVIDDGSTDDTAAICQEYNVRLIRHPYSMGNGAAVKTGARSASGDILVFMDADGQHQPADIAKLTGTLEQGYHMAVGARDQESQASRGRRYANHFYNRLASRMTDQKIADLTSGFRAVVGEKFREFLHLLPNGFSYPTTITMAFFRAGYSVAYVPIHAKPRLGNSHINPLKDGVRFMLIIFRVGTLYSPLKLFLPISVVFFGIGLAYYLYTYAIMGRFTNMSALLFITSILVFLIGLISEQITMLIYQQADKGQR